MQILDRRLNPRGRSLPNRQRFLRRAKSLVQEAVRDASAKREIRGAHSGGEVRIPLHGIREPSFHLGSGGVRDHVLPGNKEYREGDEIPRPPSGGGGGGGSEGSPEDRKSTRLNSSHANISYAVFCLKKKNIL